jgi:hypothetical protein
MSHENSLVLPAAMGQLEQCIHAFFGLLEFLESRGVLGASVVKIIE